ncbi:MAG: hypothetical protein COV55_02890 [Candidatus Komeilibacteria bacterium CG11_big_fil_rev_8_21_14_0_20_36_20]|uniref:Uncharacterized protein n=1 Tax=Candidatus Komeilibacteria bacterium CG11_big_fil_rev_8_21_14_0_20_36_20 TaxID=1974477 RepID=A0A2H0NCR6_9BACT|nr:MAG: hypothetical protein COV55_02890 [Candidatus Komeilibacteria bacterium CG11_big_fil_rev_8_21_14_0_20_36_20]
MAVVNYKTITNHPDYKKIQWSGLNSGDEGNVANFADFPDKTVQIEGTINDAVTLEGTNDSTFNVCTDSQGNQISLTSAGSRLVAENFEGIKPVVAAGTSSGVKITITMAK